MLDFVTEREHKARKPHKCFLCGRNIENGEKYFRRSGKWDGDFFDECYHLDCRKILERFFAEACTDDEWEPWEVREWLEYTYCSDCLDDDADLADCEVLVFRCRKIIEKLMGGRKEAENG